MNDIDEIKLHMKKKRNIIDTIKKNKTSPSYRLLYSFIIKTLILVLLGLIALIFIKKDEENKHLVYKYVFENNLSFTSIKSVYNKYLGGILPFDNIIPIDTPVFNEKLKYKSLNKYKDGIVLSVDKNYLVPVQEEGIITFIGEKEGYGKTVIIESENLVIWYGNLGDVSANLYDYIKKGIFLGETVDDKLYLVYKKDGKVIDYNEFI